MKQEVIVLIEIVGGGAIATPYLIPTTEPERQNAVLAIESKFRALIEECCDGVSPDDLDIAVENGRFDYDDNCSVQMHWNKLN